MLPNFSGTIYDSPIEVDLGVEVDSEEDMNDLDFDSDFNPSNDLSDETLPSRLID